MLPHLNELGMGARGKEGIAFEGSFDSRVVAVGRGAAYQWQRWQTETTIACVRVTLRIAGMMEWENNPSRYSICSHESSAGRGVIEFKVHWYVGGWNILLFCWGASQYVCLYGSLFHHFPSICAWGNDTHSPSVIWRHEKGTTGATESMMEKPKHYFLFFNRCPGELYHFILAQCSPIFMTL